MAVVTFPDGTRVHARALGARVVGPVDFGLYVYGRSQRRPSRTGTLVNRVTGRTLLGGSWMSSWEADWIHWPDFGIPADAESAAQAIIGTFRRAQRGEVVEVACFGGKGRTGTILACMATLAGVPADDAVAWVRANYSPKAVERDAQRRWVEWFASRLDPGGSPSAP
jgi:hypothetical protein